MGKVPSKIGVIFTGEELDLFCGEFEELAIPSDTGKAGCSAIFLKMLAGFYVRSRLCSGL
ncbi:MAG: hypothetical protein ACJAQT_000959 [Akkermansiaceae bacterium]|jgi:hypothetical protein